MKLTDLHPFWIVDKQKRRVGVAFDCPACGGKRDGCCCVAVHFANPLDDAPPTHELFPHWQRTGETFDTLTLTPSIKEEGGCDWHGFVTNGEVTNA